MLGQRFSWFAVVVLAVVFTTGYTKPGVVDANGVAIEFARSQVWVHATESLVTNLDADNGVIPSWDATKPTASRPLGAGGAYVANNLSWLLQPEHDPGSHFTMSGEFTGYLDSMAVNMYAYLPTSHAIGFTCAFALAFDLRIDDEPILYQGILENSSGLKVTPTSLPGLFKISYRFTHLHEALILSGLAQAPDAKHEIHLNAQNFYLCNEAVWVYDSVEAPMDVIFNPDPAEWPAYTEIDVFDPPPPCC